MYICIHIYVYICADMKGSFNAYVVFKTKQSVEGIFTVCMYIYMLRIYVYVYMYMYMYIHIYVCV
jgi:hypothetical protein